MFTEHEVRLPDLPGPLIDVDLAPSGQWVALAGDGDRRLLIFGDDAEPLPLAWRFPSVRAITNTSAIVFDSSSERSTGLNAWVISKSGEIGPSFAIGYDVSEVIVVPTGFVVTYYDLGIFSGVWPGEEGVAIFDRSGEYRWGYHSQFGRTVVEVSDCYCACLIEESEVAFFPYTEFPLVKLDTTTLTQEIRPTPEMLHGSKALTTRGDVTYFHWPYILERGICRWSPGDETPSKVGEYASPLRGLPGGRFLAKGDRGFTVITMVE